LPYIYIKNQLLKNTFHKQERLTGKKSIDLLFAKGRSVSKGPLKLIIKPSLSTQLYPAKAMFVVPKKKFKRAHDRNLLKRRMREAYRINKISFYHMLHEKGIKVSCALLYTSGKTDTYAVIESAIKELLTQSVNKLKSPA
jgi:ribonuclease P protein component